MQGIRKLLLGMVYLVGYFVLLGTVVFRGGPDAVGLVGALAASAVGLATGLGVVVYGNVATHRVQANGGKSE